MKDMFNEEDLNEYKVDYRDIYEKKDEDYSYITTTKTEIKNEPQSEEIPTLENENSVYEDDDEKYRLLVDMFKLIRVSFRVLLTVFIVILCVGLVALTAHLINNDIDEIEKNHLPYTLLCMLTGDNFNKQE